MFIDELAPAAKLSADAQHITLSVLPVEDGLAIEADRQVLRAAVMNVLQNAVKFTRPGTTVTLRVGANPDRVLIEIEDECGGLSGGSVKDLFHPFEQRGTDRSGLGLGLAFSRWAVEASHGRIYARNRPDVGCVFTIDLPRLPVSAFAIA
jgi:signal transduction histidine kinase